MTRMLLIRHGESTWNAEGRWQGQADAPLSARGEAQARAAGPAVAALPTFAGAFCSPLQRARHTAEVLAAAAGLDPPRPVPGLEEREAGPWTGLTHAEIDERHPRARASGWRPEGYETRAAMHRRVVAALAALPGDPQLLVVHEGVIRLFDDDPAPLPNLGARWFVRTGAALTPDGPRLTLAPAPALP